MTALEIKQKLLNKKEIDLSNAIFICPTLNQKYISYSYIKEYSKLKELEINNSLIIKFKDVISLSDIKQDEENVKNVIYFANAACKDLEDYDKLIYIPELSENDFYVLVKSKLNAFSQERINNFINLCNNNIFTIKNELDKITINEDAAENVAQLTEQGNYIRLQKPSANNLLMSLITKNPKGYLKELNKETALLAKEEVKSIYEKILKELKLMILLKDQEKVTKTFLKSNFIDEAEYKFLKINCLELFNKEDLENKINYINVILSKEVTIVNLKHNLITLYLK